MTNIDQFESVFRSADKLQFQLVPFSVENVIVITDKDTNASDSFSDECRELLSEVTRGTELKWTVLGADRYQDIDDLVAQMDEYQPDMICTYRNLKAPTKQFNYTLGSYLDIMTQAIVVPVLVLPHPDLNGRGVPKNTDSVMVITDHLTGDNRLVSAAVHFTDPTGTLQLTHVEDEQQLRRFLDTIAKIPELSTHTAETSVLEQLLKEPRDYIESCKSSLQQQVPKLTIESVVTTGSRLKDYQQLIEEHDVDLLVINTKDDEQLAMHGLAYPLTVELRDTPMLLL